MINHSHQPQFDTWEAFLYDFDKDWSELRMTENLRFLSSMETGVRTYLLLEMAKIDMDRRFENSERLRVEDYLENHCELSSRPEVIRELIRCEIELRLETDEPFLQEEFEERFPEFLADWDSLHRTAVDESRSGVPQNTLKPKSIFENIPCEFGRYRIKKVLGCGTMGEVYLATDNELERDVALKFPYFSEIDKSKRIERFHREALAAAKLHHPNICPIFDVGQHEDKNFIAMAYVKGRRLDEIIDGGSLSQDKATDLICKLASALDSSHKAGIVHGDIKPANIIVDERDEPILTDFSLARPFDQTETVIMAASGLFDGTPSYMAPEQVRGQREKIGKASDVYSLGVLFYELLTGSSAYSGSLTEVLLQISSQEPFPNPEEKVADLNPNLVAICGKMTAKDVRDRYRSMQEVCSDMKPSTENARERNQKTILSKTGIVIALVVVFSLALLSIWGIPKLFDSAETIAKQDEEPTKAFLLGTEVARWSFDGAGNNSVDDKLHGRLMGGADYVDGKFGQCIELNGEDGFFHVDHDPLLDVGRSDFSISVWIYRTEVSDGDPIASKGSNHQFAGWKIGVDSWTGDGETKLEHLDGSMTLQTDHQNENGVISHHTIHTPKNLLQLNRWQHVVVSVKRSIVEGNRTVLYIDGEEAGRGQVSPDDLSCPTHDFFIGRIDQFMFKGRLDDARFYLHALNPHEIRKLYLNGEDSEKSTQKTIPSSNVTKWKMIDVFQAFPDLPKHNIVQEPWFTKGEWRLENGVLRNTHIHSLLEVPVELGNEYRIEMDFTRISTEESFIIGLPLGERTAALGFSNHAGVFHGISIHDDRKKFPMYCKYRPGRLENGIRYHLEINVRNSKDEVPIEVILNGVKIVSYSRKAEGVKDIAHDNGFTSRNGSYLVIGTSASYYRFENLEISQPVVTSTGNRFMNTIDVLKTFPDLPKHKISPTKWYAQGKWTQRDGVLQNEHTYSLVEIPVELGRNYRIELDFTRISTDEGTVFSLPLGKRSATLALSNRAGLNHLLNVYDEKKKISWGREYLPGILETGKKYHLEITVRDSGDEIPIEVALNGAKLFSSSQPVKKTIDSIHKNSIRATNGNYFTIGATASFFRFENLRIWTD